MLPPYLAENKPDQVLLSRSPARALPSFATLDLNAEVPLGKEWKLQGKINNLTDRTYYTAYGYNQPGRGVYVTLKYQPR